MLSVIPLIQVFLELGMLIFSIVLVLLETIITAITVLLPSPVIAWFTSKARQLLKRTPLKGQAQLSNDPGLKQIVDRVRLADGFLEICDIFNFEAEEHIVSTKDGYLLGVHRIAGRQGEHWRDNPPSKKPVVYLHHGLLMNSEIWVACTDPEQSVAFKLANLGYDVWLGNNRGNKYSHKHLSRSPSSSKFWNFGLDEFALYDIPDTIDYILNATGQETLSYIGFSQGSAQAFAALSIHPQLNHKVEKFIALAPAMAPPGINAFVQSFTNASPSMLYMVFGNKIILRSAAFWQSIMYPPLFVRVIDFALDYLFHWKSLNISYAQKMVGYAHLYSFTSVKSVVHWFQIIRAQAFQMYDDDSWHPFSLEKFNRRHQYPTRNIRTPITIIYGTTDSLLDITSLLAELPKSTRIFGVSGYEHLDMIWGDAVRDQIIPTLAQVLNSSEASSHTPEKKLDGSVEPKAIEAPPADKKKSTNRKASRSARDVVNDVQIVF